MGEKGMINSFAGVVEDNYNRAVAVAPLDSLPTPADGAMFEVEIFAVGDEQSLVKTIFMNEDRVNFVDTSEAYMYTDFADNCFMCYIPV